SRLRAQTCPRLQPGSLGKCARADLLTAVHADAADLDLSAGGRDGQAGVVDSRHFTRRSGCDARELSCVEKLHGLPFMRRPGAWLWIGAADQIPDLLQGLLPVDLNVLLLAPAFVGGLALVLANLRRRARTDQIDRLHQSGDTERIQPIEVEAAQGVGVLDL